MVICLRCLYSHIISPVACIPWEHWDWCAVYGVYKWSGSLWLMGRVRLFAHYSLSLSYRHIWRHWTFKMLVSYMMYKITPILPITSTQVAADRGALRIWRWVSLPEGGQKLWLQWQLADTAWLNASTRSVAERPSNAPTQSHSLQRSYPHLNSIFASKLHALDPFRWVICIRLIRWHGANLQTAVKYI